MNNPDDTKNAGQPKDHGEDSEERQEDARQAWRDRQGIPRGTPEQGGRSADRVGGDGSSRPGPELDDDAVEPGSKRAPEVDDVDDIDEKR